MKAEEGEIDSGKEATSRESKSNRSQKLRKQIERTRKELEEAQRKSSKIDRACIKAEAENNRTNMKKCLKYKEKYALKVEKLRESLASFQAKRAKLGAETAVDTSRKVAEVLERTVKRKGDAKEKEGSSDAVSTKRLRLSPTSLVKKALPSVEQRSVIASFFLN